MTIHRTIRQLVAVSVHASDRASGVINALRHYLHSGPPGQAVHFDTSETIRMVLPLFQHRVRHGILLEADLHPDLIVLGWQDKVSQVWVNLMTNALQSVQFDGTVTIRSRKEGSLAVVEVEDDGPGIPDELKEKVFQPFFTTKKPGEGTGLGLDLCRKVVEELQGTISFESCPGHTVFTVRIPLAEGLE